MRREKTGDKCWGFVHFLAISSAVRGFHVNKDIWKPSNGDKLACESSIVALTNLPSKLSTTEKRWAIYHASSRR